LFSSSLFLILPSILSQAADSVAAKLNSAPIFLMTQLITTISHHLPKTEPELATFRRTLESPCRLLEAKLRNFGFYLSDNADAGNYYFLVICLYILNFSVKFLLLHTKPHPFAKSNILGTNNLISFIFRQ
jgi:hypothetical protein